MPITTTCPNPECARSSRLPKEAVGRKVTCPGCRRPFVVPPTATPTVVLPPPSTDDDSRPPVATPLATALHTIGRFVVRVKVGEGAFGVVYRAQDPHLDREVALKVPHAAVLDNPKRVERFLREARAAANLRHPHIVPVYDAGTDGGRHYIASAFIDGIKLADAVDANKRGMDFGRAARLVRELAEALAYAHEEGIVHRDVKPDNVMLDAADRVHLMDFGLAVKQDAEARLTRDGAVMGTPSYMAPEQAKGQTEAIGPAADQYACGVVLYELLTGKPPFVGPLVAVMHHHINTPPEPPTKHRPNIPRDLETICLMALNKQPEDRYADCGELADDLRRWLKGEPVRVRPLNPAERVVRWVRTEPKVAVAVAVVLLVLSAGTAAVAVFAQQARDAQERAEHALQQMEEKEMQRLAARDETTGALGSAAEERERAKRFEERAKSTEEKAKAAEAESALMKQDRNGFRDQAADARAVVADTRQRLETAREENDALKKEVAQLRAQPDRSPFRGPAVQFNHQLTKVNSLAFSPDGAHLLIAGDDPAPRVYDTATGKEVYRLTGHKLAVNSVAFSPDGTHIVTASLDTTARVWEVKSRTVHRTLEGHTRSVSSAAFSPDGKRIVTASLDGTARVWEVKPGTKEKVLSTDRSGSGRTHTLLFAAFSPDGSRVVTAGAEHHPRVWKVETQEVAFSLLGHTGQVNWATFSTGGSRLVTASEDGSVGLWDGDSGQRVRTLIRRKGDAERPAEGVPFAVFSPDTTRVIVPHDSRTVRAFDPDTGNEVYELDGHQGGVRAAAFSPDGSRLATADGKAVRLWVTGSTAPPEKK